MSIQSSATSSSGVTFCGLLTIVFITLKLTDTSVGLGGGF